MKPKQTESIEDTIDLHWTNPEQEDLFFKVSKNRYIVLRSVFHRARSCTCVIITRSASEIFCRFGPTTRIILTKSLVCNSPSTWCGVFLRNVEKSLDRAFEIRPISRRVAYREFLRSCPTIIDPCTAVRPRRVHYKCVARCYQAGIRRIVSRGG